MLVRAFARPSCRRADSGRTGVTWLEGCGLVALGFAVGAYGTMVGLGGGFFLVPALLFMHQPARVAAGTSMAVVFANATSGTISYLRQRRVDVRSGLLFAAAGVPGAFLGAAVDQHLPHRLFAVLLACLLIVVAVRMLFGTSYAAASRTSEPQPRRYNVAVAVALAFGVGFIASMFGIGGGIIQVPSMIYLLSFPAHIATATSHFTIALTALFGTASHIYYGDVLPLPAILLATGAIGGAQLGAWLSQRLNAAPLLRWLSLAAFFVAGYLLFGYRG